MQRLLLKNGFSPGDIVMLTAAVRDLHRCYPGRFLTDVRTPSPDLWLHNPHITSLKEADPRVQVLECHYPLIDQADAAPYHCLHGFIAFLNEQLGLAIRPTAFRGDIHLSHLERSWFSQVHELTRRELPFWIIAAGGKHDVTCKWWSPHRYQTVVDHFRDRIQFVQVGALGDHHPKLEGAIDLRGRTTLRELVRLVYHAQGVLCPVTAVMHLAAAVPMKMGAPGTRPCVVVAGGREPAHWEAYPGHQFIHTNGALTCCAAGGCWKDRVTPLGDGDPRDHPRHRCVDVVRGLPRCLDLITVEDVIRRIQVFFENGVCRFLTIPEGRAAAQGVRSSCANDFDWQPLSKSSVRLATARAVQSLELMKPGQGRGIVLCGGGARYFTCAWVCINRLRALGCRLPIELWHLGIAELDSAMRGIIEPLGVRCIDALRLRRRFPMRRLGGWELKAYALCHSAFTEVLLLDADNVPIRNPAFLFESAPYLSTGALFWPDLGGKPGSALWGVLGLRRPAEPEFESGQILVDRRRCGAALALARWFNENSDFFYQHMHGDKETFHMAFRRLRQPYTLISHPIQPLDATMCQHDPDGNRLFQHRNGDKWNLLLTNRRVAGFRHEAACRRLVERLRELWDGRIAGSGTNRPKRVRWPRKLPAILPVMISCADRPELRQQTLNSFAKTDWAAESPLVEMDSELGEQDRRVRQTRTALKALRRGLESGIEYILFLEDDLIFNRHLWHNLMSWRPLREGRLTLGGLYNPGLRESACSVVDQAAIVCSDHIYGSQALLLSRPTLTRVVRNWNRCHGMQDIRISRLGARSGTAFYHGPSLVQHVGVHSLWGGAYHRAVDFDPDWRAGGGPPRSRRR